MEKDYIVTPDGSFVSINELQHSGIKGMKWGIRRYQNKDGSLTPAGRKRYTNKDGSLNEKGKKYLANEQARLKAEKAKMTNQKRTDAKLDKLDQMRKENEALKAKTGDPDDVVQTSKKKPASDMSDKELQDKVNRLRNEDAYNDLSKKLGYDGPKTELDAKIAEMEKQKKYLELQRDIANLTPKKVSKGKKIFDTIVNNVIAPAAKKAGKEYLEKYLSNAAAEALKNTAKKQGSKVGDTVKNATEKAKQQEANKQAKQQAKAEKKAAKQAVKEETKTNKRNDSDNIKFTVEGEGTSSRSNSTNSNYQRKGGVIDMEPWPALNAGVSTVTTSSNTSSGRRYVSGYLNSPIAGLLPAPKDDR